MSRLFQESFDRLTPAQLGTTGKWASVGSGVVTVTGRTGNGVSGTLGASAAENTMQSQAFAVGTPSTGYHGFAVKYLSLPVSEQKLWALLDNTGTVQVTLTITPTGTCNVYRGTMAGTLLGSSPLAMVESAFRYLEIGHILTGSGRVEMRSTPASGTARVFSATGAIWTTAWSQIELYLTDQIIVDDLYTNDGVASVGNNYFSGDTTILTVVPTLKTFHTFYFPWTPNSGSDLVAPIDDATQDGDTTYLYTRDSYSTIQYQMEAITDDGRRVDDVQIVAIIRGVSSAWLPGILVSWLRWDGIGLSVPFAQNPLTTAYRAFMTLTQRTGGLEWTIARVNASRFGVRS